jgi:hypothetical protein
MTPEQSPADALAATGDASDQPLKPLNLLLGAAFVLGLGLFALSFRGRSAA